jgi:hypothetical protein
MGGATMKRFILIVMICLGFFFFDYYLNAFFDSKLKETQRGLDEKYRPRFYGVIRMNPASIQDASFSGLIMLGEASNNYIRPASVPR